MTYATIIAVAHIGWMVQIFVDPPLRVTVAVVVGLAIVELLGPVVAERIDDGTPWHPHHIVERYGLLVIIMIGEVVLGTILAISAVVEKQGWSLEAAFVAFGGTALAFDLWWVYFTMPSGEVLARHRERGFGWGYGHLLIFGSLAATGGGLHVAANVIEGAAHIGRPAALLTVVIPVAIFTAALFTLYSLMLRTGILITACAPLVVIVGYETVGHRHQASVLDRALTRT